MAQFRLLNIAHLSNMGTQPILPIAARCHSPARRAGFGHFGGVERDGSECNR